MHIKLEAYEQVIPAASTTTISIQISDTLYI